MPKVGLHQLDQSGATDGQAPLWSDAAGEYVPGTPPGGSGLPWFNVADPAYGAVGNGTTDDTAAINLAIAALNTAGRGVLYFPAGTYLVSSALTPLTVSATVQGDGSSDAYGISTGKYVSAIVCTSATANCMEIGQSGSMVRDLAFVNSNGSETAGAALYVTGGEHNVYSNLVVYGFYDNMYIPHGGGWHMSGCFFTKPVRYSVYINYIVGPDGGDQVIEGCNFYAKDRNATSAVRLERGGGLKFLGNKINTNSGSGYYSYGLDLNIPSGVATSVLTMVGNSVEDATVNGLRVLCNGTANYDMITVTGNEFANYTSGSGSAIDLNCATTGNIRAVVMSGNTIRANPSRSTAAINLTNVNNAVIGSRTIEGFSSAYASSGGSGVVDGMGGGLADPTTTKGDLITHGTTTGRKGVGTNGQVLTADSTQTDGLAWATPFSDPTATKGDLIVHGSATARFGVGSDGQVLTADSTQTAGVKWATPSAGAGFGLTPITTLDDSGNLTFLTTEDGSLLLAED